MCRSSSNGTGQFSAFWQAKSQNQFTSLSVELKHGSTNGLIAMKKANHGMMLLSGPKDGTYRAKLARVYAMTVKEYKNAFSAQYGIFEIGIFGSVARGGAKVTYIRV